jgi:hypothetical protein
MSPYVTCETHTLVLEEYSIQRSTTDTPTKDKTEEETHRAFISNQRVFDQFPKDHMKVTSGDFNAKVGTENIFQATLQNKSLHEMSNHDAVRVVNFNIS